MRKYLAITILFSALIIIVSCKKENSEEPFGTTSPTEQLAMMKTPMELGEEIFYGKGACASCHQANTKQIGPSLYEIAKIYKEMNGNMVGFLKEQAEPIVDPEQYELMKTNLALTKTFSDDELKALETYIYSHLK